MNSSFWRGKRVFLTGHTGFKGGWLALWLAEMGAEVHGFALTPSTTPNLFTLAGVERAVSRHTIGDIRDLAALKAAIEAAKPDVVLHLAAQALVLDGYDDPVGTFDANVMGTVNLMQACRDVASIKGIVIVSSDKCYENREVIWPYREGDAMGGHDPYSASKGCTELVAASMARSFFTPSGIPVATARAGNVIGGGDWSANRLFVDLMQGLLKGETVTLRSPNAVRPWQHVLEPLSGYLRLAQYLVEGKPSIFEGWNFGPESASERNVLEVATGVAALLGRTDLIAVDPASAMRHEATLLTLDATKARRMLGWKPKLTFEETLAWSVEWYGAWSEGRDIKAVTARQIAEFTGRV